jgi:hypothetical protein
MGSRRKAVAGAGGGGTRGGEFAEKQGGQKEQLDGGARRLLSYSRDRQAHDLR